MITGNIGVESGETHGTYDTDLTAANGHLNNDFNASKVSNTLQTEIGAETAAETAVEVGVQAYERWGSKDTSADQNVVAKESDSLTKQLINDAIQAKIFSVEPVGSENNEPVSGSSNSQVDASSLEVAGNDTQNPAGVTTQVYKRGSPEDPYADYTDNPGFGSSEKNDPDAGAHYSIQENVTGYSLDSAGSTVSASGKGTVAPEPAGEKPDSIPDNWIEKPTKKGGGVRYTNPDNPNDFVRVMPGNSKSNFPAQQNSYVIRSKNGRIVDGNGRPVSSSDPSAHIPLSEFKFQ